MPLTLIERAITPTNAKPGMIITLGYKDRTYTAFVIDPFKPNKYSGNLQLHIYTLSGVTPQDFVNILVNLNADLIVDAANKEIRTSELSETQAFEAKYILRGADTRPYRTLNTTDVFNVKQIYIELPRAIDDLLSGNVNIANKSSKRMLLTCAEKNDIECIKKIPEIREVLNVSTSYTEQDRLREEAAEREKIQQTRRRPVQQVLGKIVDIKRRVTSVFYRSSRLSIRKKE